MFWLLGPKAYGILASPPGTETAPLHWKAMSLATELPGRSRYSYCGKRFGTYTFKSYIEEESETNKVKKSQYTFMQHSQNH